MLVFDLIMSFDTPILCLDVFLFRYLDYRSCMFLFKLRSSGTPHYLSDILSSAIFQRTLNFILPHFPSNHLCMFLIPYAC